MKDKIYLVYNFFYKKFKKNINPEYFESGHYYSVIPSVQDIEKRFYNDKYNLNDLRGIDINCNRQLELLNEYKLLSESSPFYSDIKKDRFFIDNDTFSYDDAPILHYFMRSIKPKRIIEVGSGKSSALMLDTNDSYFNNSIEFIFIDIDTKNLKSILKDKDYKNVQIIESPVQEVDIEIFSKLDENDLLFIDSSHVSKLGSDLHSIIFNILPSLNSGVFIHFHDIRFPFDYSEGLARRSVFWNEAYILRAFLQFNSQFKVHFWLNYLLNCELIKENGVTEFLPLKEWADRFNGGVQNYSDAGGSIYLRKV